MIEQTEKIGDFFALTWLSFAGPVTYVCACLCQYACVYKHVYSCSYVYVCACACVHVYNVDSNLLCFCNFSDNSLCGTKSKAL